MISYENYSMPELSAEEEQSAALAYERLLRGEDGMADRNGWLCPNVLKENLIDEMLSLAERLRRNSEIIFIVGIGGSYLGAKAAIDLLRPVPGPGCPEIRFVGHTLSGDTLNRELKLASEKSFSVILISKSGSTLEVSANSSLFFHLLQEKYGDEAKNRLAVVTGSKGPLRSFADSLSCPVFSVPENTGGRYSVFTPVGLLPMAAAGIDISAVLRGASSEAEGCRGRVISYAARRYRQFLSGRRVELLCAYRPEFRSFSEWWRQLFAESEGKNGLGLFPAYAEFPADLHSIGQYIQQGSPILFETFIEVQSSASSLCIPASVLPLSGNISGGLPYSTAEAASLQGAKAAHTDAGIPVESVCIPSVCEESLGALMQFFMVSCGVSACLLGVNPFDQPGVEAYKKYMVQILKG